MAGRMRWIGLAAVYGLGLLGWRERFVDNAKRVIVSVALLVGALALVNVGLLFFVLSLFFHLAGLGQAVQAALITGFLCLLSSVALALFGWPRADRRNR